MGEGLLALAVCVQMHCRLATAAMPCTAMPDASSLPVPAYLPARSVHTGWRSAPSCCRTTFFPSARWPTRSKACPGWLEAPPSRCSRQDTRAGGSGSVQQLSAAALCGCCSAPGSSSHLVSVGVPNACPPPPPVQVSFAADNNFGDVSAKATSQTICASIVGTSAGGWVCTRLLLCV